MNRTTLMGKVYDIQGFSIQDGPGIRTTIFLKGCPLRCPWCHSPESQAFHTQLSWISMRCIGIEECGKCINTCEKGAIKAGEITKKLGTDEDIQYVLVDRSLCDDCGECTKVCHPGGLSMCGQDYSVEELLDRASKDIPFYEQSGGGVTISGGEALSQPEFTIELLKGLKERKISTALDTTGFADSKYIDQVLPYADLFLYDLKHMNSEKHKQIIGVPNERILENAKQIAKAGGKLQIRIPIIPQFNDSEENIIRASEFCKSLGEAVVLVQLLPYHNLGVVKYQRIKNHVTVLEATPPSEEKMQSIKEVLKSYGLNVTVH